MNIKLYVEEDDNTHSIDLDLSGQKLSEIERLTILSQVFNAANIDKNFSKMVDDYIKIGQAYKEFFSEVDPIEPSDREPLDLKLRYNEEITTKEQDKPDYYATGVIEDDEGERYKCRLHCDCGNNQNIYIDKDAKKVDCPNCGAVHQKRAAKIHGFPSRDRWGNYFIAGNFRGEDE